MTQQIQNNVLSVMKLHLEIELFFKILILYRGVRLGLRQKLQYKSNKLHFRARKCNCRHYLI